MCGCIKTGAYDVLETLNWGVFLHQDIRFFLTRFDPAPTAGGEEENLSSNNTAFKSRKDRT